MTTAWGRITPAQWAMLQLAGNVIRRSGPRDRPETDEARVESMREGRALLQKLTGRDHGYDLAAWDALLRADAEGRWGYRHPYGWRSTAAGVRRALADPGRPRLVALAGSMPTVDREARRPVDAPPRVLALDLEGTLISSAVSQFPRPGLRDFLAWALAAFERVVIFSSVRAEVARSVLATLVEYGDAPAAFADVEIVAWQGKVKDLSFVRDATPAEVVLVDDQERVVHPAQRDRWVAIAEWDDPAVTDDRELERVRTALAAMRSPAA